MKQKERKRVWQTMSGHDPASLVVPPLRRKERRPEERGGSVMRGRYERRKKKEKDRWSVAAHALKRAIKRAADAATRPESRMSIVPAHLIKRLRLSIASA